MSFNTRSMIVIVNNFHNSPISNQSGSTFHFVVRSTPPESFFWQLLLTMERILVEYKFRIFLGRDYVNDTIWKKIFVIQNNLLQCRLPTFCHFGDVDEVVKWRKKVNIMSNELFIWNFYKIIFSLCNKCLTVNVKMRFCQFVDCQKLSKW